MHECMYISTLADPDFQEGENISDKIVKLHPKIFHFESLAKNVSYLSAKIFDDPLLFPLVIDHFFGIFTSTVIKKLIGALLAKKRRYRLIAKSLNVHYSTLICRDIQEVKSAPEVNCAMPNLG